ncbi:hypothetical protein SAMD00019534_037800 [Acytostelium subglobosum LB1]|uniref:hypothetical protein n=1 Tax=Acytostelium subglobosum LB1 TaxID=1410327 RepID=UPI000644EDEC|nr:hypothetical protein SAMD00019534_037800 [Acytostelium subglobosum LB1]GAM20605.1 hypothetical protein SAMD00019534_037800 [Acytostelium subglobosum LB1]|eukprot:XP_012760126.1 hypothetical protein SAMD00019534_037800 [Acytostelium subglobosum LB1]
MNTLLEIDFTFKSRQFTLLLKQAALIFKQKERANYSKYLNTETITGFDEASEAAFPNRVILHACINVSTDKNKEVRKRKDYLLDFESPLDSKKFTSAIQQHVLDRMPGGPPQNRRVRVILNPKSGKRMAETIYKNIEQLLKNDAKMFVKKTTTKGPDHAKQIGYKFNYEKYDTIAFISGDGLFHEFINGLLARDDWMQAKNIRLCLIPAGTGNGIACSLGLADSMSSALACVRGCARPLDISIVQQGAQKWASILSLTWGLVSDVDIESERFRALGPIRLHLGAFLRIMNLRVYQGKIKYLPALDQPKSELSKIPKCGPTCEICRSVDSAQTINNILSNSTDSLKGSNGILKDSTGINRSGQILKGSSDTQWTIQSSSADLTASSLSSSTPSPASLSQSINGDDTTAAPVKPLNLSSSTSSSPLSYSQSSVPSSPKVATREIVVPQPKVPSDNPLQQSTLSEEWKTIEGDFIGFIASTVTHLSSDFIASPSAHYSDGFIEMVVIKHSPKISKAALISILTDAETGKHIHSPFIDLYKVKAIILEPGLINKKEGILAVDGERISYGTTSMECIRGCINLVCKDR